MEFLNTFLTPDQLIVKVTDNILLQYNLDFLQHSSIICNNKTLKAIKMY